MKAIVIYQAGDAQQLQVEERPIPTLKEGVDIRRFRPHPRPFAKRLPYLFLFW